MPNRILRDYTESAAFDGITPDAERLWVRLVTKADDFGRYNGDPRAIKAGCFPLLETLRTNELVRWLDELSHRKLILRYENRHRAFLVLLRFRQRLRQKMAKYPPPDGKPDDWMPPDDSELLTFDGPLTARNEEKRNEYEEEEETNTNRTRARASCVDDVISFCAEEGLPESDARYLWIKWEENGWGNGGRRIKDWRMTIQKWKAGGWLPSQKNKTNGHTGERARDEQKTGLKYTQEIRTL